MYLHTHIYVYIYTSLYILLLVISKAQLIYGWVPSIARSCATLDCDTTGRPRREQHDRWECIQHNTWTTSAFRVNRTFNVMSTRYNTCLCLTKLKLAVCPNLTCVFAPSTDECAVIRTDLTVFRHPPTPPTYPGGDKPSLT